MAARKMTTYKPPRLRRGAEERENKMTDTTATVDTTATTSTRCVLVYREMIAQDDGRYEIGGSTVLGDEEGDHDEERCVCDSDAHAMSVFLDNLTDCGALGMGDACSEEWAEDVTESEGFHGWGAVVRHSWVALDGEHQSRLYSVITVPAEEWLAEIHQE